MDHLDLENCTSEELCLGFSLIYQDTPTSDADAYEEYGEEIEGFHIIDVNDL